MNRERIENYVKSLNLKKAKPRGNEFMASCPFHNDDNPSWSINLDTGKWLCFSASCGRHGNLQQLVKHFEGYNWVSVYQDIVGRTFVVKTVTEEKKRDLIKDANEAMNNSILITDDMVEKNISPVKWLLDKTGIPFSSLYSFMPRLGISGNINNFIIFPVYNLGDKFKGTVCRSASWKNKKYFTYVDGSTLWPEWQFKTFVDGTTKVHELFIVEGVFDAIKIFQLGYVAIAMLGSGWGTRLPNLLKLAEKFTELIVCFDMDATDKSKKLATELSLLEAKKDISYLDFNDVGKDPKDLDLVMFNDAIDKKRRP